MNARTARRIRLGIQLGRADLVAARFNLTPLGPMLLMDEHPIAVEAWSRTLDRRRREPLREMDR